MIDLTGEMLQVAHRALAPKGGAPAGLVKALTDVLALIDRDYQTVQRGPRVPQPDAPAQRRAAA